MDAAREKQKVRRIYGATAFPQLIYSCPPKGVTGEILLQLLELRLDIVFCRALPSSRPEARQRMPRSFCRQRQQGDIPSYQCSWDESRWAAQPGSEKFKVIRELAAQMHRLHGWRKMSKLCPLRLSPCWREDIDDIPIAEHPIIDVIQDRPR